MDENAIRQWFIDCFGPIQGEMAWNQFSNMPEELRDQLMSQDVSKLPKPAEVRSMMQAFTASGFNTFGDIQHITEEGPINVKLAKSLALQRLLIWSIPMKARWISALKLASHPLTL